MRRLMIAVAFVLALAGPAAARSGVAGVVAGGSVPLTDILALAKPYPNLVMELRLQLVRANLKSAQVVCTGDRFGPQWTSLGGTGLAPYQCVIGKRTVSIAAAQTYFDRNGRKVKPADPDLPLKAAKVKESGLKWQWK